MSLLQVPSKENLLLSVYSAMRKNAMIDSNALVAVYEQHFQPVTKPISDLSQPIERFTLIDPSIRTVVTSNTAS